MKRKTFRKNSWKKKRVGSHSHLEKPETGKWNQKCQNVID